MRNDGAVVEKVVLKFKLNLSLNPACGDSTGCNRIGKDHGRVSPRLVRRRWRKGSVIECVELL